MNVSPRIIVVWLALMIVPATAQSRLEDIERALADAIAKRNASSTSRERLLADASVLAAEIDVAKRQERTSRADPDLAQLLRRFDRLVEQLDRQQAELDEATRRVDRLRTAFEELAAEQAARLGTVSDPVKRVAALGEIETARRRVATLAPREVQFRPVLNITLGPTDLPAEIEHKMSLVTAERKRVVAELGRIDRELAVVATRLLRSRALLDDLRGSSAPSSELALVTREANALADSIRQLERQYEALDRARPALVASQRALDAQVEQFKRRLAQLSRPGD